MRPSTQSTTAHGTSLATGTDSRLGLSIALDLQLDDFPGGPQQVVVQKRDAVGLGKQRRVVELQEQVARPQRCAPSGGRRAG